MKRIAASLLGVWVLGVTGAALADDPDPLEIIKKADAATKAVTAVSYDVKAWGEGGMKYRVPKFEGKLTAKAHEDPMFPYLNCEVTLQQPGTEVTMKQRIIIGEDSVLFEDNQRKEVLSFANAPGRVGQTLQTVWMREFVHDNPFGDEMEGDERRYEGTKKIGDTECHVIYVVYKDKAGLSRWYFGKDDSLPRRVDRIDTEGDASFSVEITGLDTTPKIDADTFKVPKTTTKPAKPEKDDDGDKDDDD